VLTGRRDRIQNPRCCDDSGPHGWVTPQPLWRILIVEDDPVINVMLQDMLVKLRCMAVGPAGSVAAALSLIETTPLLDGAVLDCNLGGDKVWPVADRLVERRVPFVFSTGYGQAGIAP
jgi:CheY-like chemotaxis protein